MKTLLKITMLALATSGAQAAVVVTDNAGVTPTIGAEDTGYTGALTDRFGWDTETFGQTFTMPSASTLDSIYIVYNGFDDGDTLTMNLLVNGATIATGVLLDGDNFSGDAASDTNNSPVYWMRFDVSAENVALNAGSNNFSMVATANTGSSWALAPMRNINNVYAGGSSTGVGGGGDLGFVVTAVPEPSSSALIGLGGIALIFRRRK